MHDESSASRVPVCSICNQPVWLNDAKTDEDGQAIHEGCYVTKIHLIRSGLVQSDGDQAKAQSRNPVDVAKKKPRPEL
jgi:hypothetical protein